MVFSYGVVLGHCTVVCGRRLSCSGVWEKNFRVVNERKRCLTVVCCELHDIV